MTVCSREIFFAALLRSQDSPAFDEYFSSLPLASRIGDSTSRKAVNFSSARTTNRFSVAAVRVCNPDRSPAEINGRDVTVAPTAFLEIVSDDFPAFHAMDYAHRRVQLTCANGSLEPPVILLANCAWKDPRLPQRHVPRRTVSNQPTREVRRLSIPLLPP